MSRIAAVVVLYNPGEEVLRSIDSYIRQVEVLFAVDNSASPDPAMTRRIKEAGNVVYLWNGKNVGVATALNIGAGLAMERQCDFLLLMDQDSTVPPDLVSAFNVFIAGTSSAHVGIVAPRIAYENFKMRPGEEGARDVAMAITSGTLLNLSAYRAVGPFMDELFIDYVDFEYCLRMRARGFRVVQLGGVTVQQKLGDLVPRWFVYRRVAVMRHPPVRVYYRFRNRLVVSMKYVRRFPFWSVLELRLTVNELVKILCFERQKRERCGMAFRGIADFFAHRLGQFNDGLVRNGARR